ncbi:hypothetical protein HZH68_015223 [Vespula germanica]|uniref:Uncharacterized protein n=1 Tax=Vespula germanica TaxID=30212 RepID=A0A834J8C4_VESGE|nr:hypothetical protein HZH68_015223 [Vespula germanica]
MGKEEEGEQHRKSYGVCPGQQPVRRNEDERRDNEGHLPSLGISFNDNDSLNPNRIIRADKLYDVQSLCDNRAFPTPPYFYKNEDNDDQE